MNSLTPLQKLPSYDVHTYLGRFVSTTDTYTQLQYRRLRDAMMLPLKYANLPQYTQTNTSCVHAWSYASRHTYFGSFDHTKYIEGSRSAEASTCQPMNGKRVGRLGKRSHEDRRRFSKDTHSQLHDMHTYDICIDTHSQLHEMLTHTHMQHTSCRQTQSNLTVTLNYPLFLFFYPIQNPHF